MRFEVEKNRSGVVHVVPHDSYTIPAGCREITLESATQEQLKFLCEVIKHPWVKKIEEKAK